MKVMQVLRRAKRAVARLFGSNPRRLKLTDKDASQPLIQSFQSFQLNAFDNASADDFLKM